MAVFLALEGILFGVLLIFLIRVRKLLAAAGLIVGLLVLEELELLKLYIRPVLEDEGWEGLTGYRPFTERIFPHLAEHLRLKAGWDYKKLYLAVLEELAKKLRLKRFYIYTVEEMVEEVQKKLGTLDSRLPI